jgi:prepilin-type N-terminal cleavage/methylation domain-containing protein
VGLPAPQRPSAPARGSTLIELIVVLALIALLFGVAIPALTAIPAPGEGAGLDSLRLAAVRSGEVVRGDSIVAFPDGRVVRTGGTDGR